MMDNVERRTGHLRPMSRNLRMYNNLESGWSPLIRSAFLPIMGTVLLACCRHHCQTVTALLDPTWESRYRAPSSSS